MPFLMPSDNVLEPSIVVLNNTSLCAIAVLGYKFLSVAPPSSLSVLLPTSMAAQALHSNFAKPCQHTKYLTPYNGCRLIYELGYCFRITTVTNDM